MNNELMMRWKIKCLDMFDVPPLLSGVEASKEKGMGVEVRKGAEVTN
jgi:hypothetical protein